jgi:hypothetical protein
MPTRKLGTTAFRAWLAGKSGAAQYCLPTAIGRRNFGGITANGGGTPAVSRQKFSIDMLSAFREI